MTILLATNNFHKKQELDLLFHNLCPLIKLRLPVEEGLQRWDHQENGKSFLENALGKAHALFQDLGRRSVVLADDSGLCVDALNGAPGIFSARWGQQTSEKTLSDKDRNQLLLNQIPDGAKRTARLVCALALVVAPHRVFTVEESWEGEIASQESTEKGFGYDPIFYLPDQNMTAAELGLEKKNALSHRGKAFRALASLLQHLAHFD